MISIPLIIEKGENGILWGTITYDDNFLVESAKTMVDLEKQLKKLLKDFHQLESENVQFTY